jgi:hypothetical protein
VAILNPSTSQRLVVIETVDLMMVGLSAGVVNIGLQTETNLLADAPNLELITVYSTRDSRFLQPGAGNASIEIRTGPVAAVNAAFRLWQGITQPSLLVFGRVLEDVVLLPGFGLVVSYPQVGANSALSPNFRWYERLLEASEQKG